MSVGLFLYCSFWCKWVLNILLSTDIFSNHLKKKMGVTPKVIRLSNSCEIRSTKTEQSGIEQTLRKQARMSNSSNFIFSSAEHRRYCRFFCISFFFNYMLKWNSLNAIVKPILITIHCNPGFTRAHSVTKEWLNTLQKTSSLIFYYLYWI